MIVIFCTVFRVFWQNQRQGNVRALIWNLVKKIARINIKRHLTNQKLIHGDTVTNAINQMQNGTKNSKIGNWPQVGPKMGGAILHTPFFSFFGPGGIAPGRAKREM
jgi:hypothetical protein